jgi:hypothetical protein
MDGDIVTSRHNGAITSFLDGHVVLLTGGGTFQITALGTLTNNNFTNSGVAAITYPTGTVGPFATAPLTQSTTNTTGSLATNSIGLTGFVLYNYQNAGATSYLNTLPTTWQITAPTGNVQTDSHAYWSYSVNGGTTYNSNIFAQQGNAGVLANPITITVTPPLNDLTTHKFTGIIPVSGYWRVYIVSLAGANGTNTGLIYDKSAGIQGNFIFQASFVGPVILKLTSTVIWTNPVTSAFAFSPGTTQWNWCGTYDNPALSGIFID